MGTFLIIPNTLIFRVRGESEDALMKTETEVRHDYPNLDMYPREQVRALEAEEAALRLKVERADEERRGLEGEVVALLRDQVNKHDVGVAEPLLR